MTAGDASASSAPADGATLRRRRTATGVLLLIAAPSFWLLHLLVSYALVPWSCRIDSDLPLYAVTVAAAVTAAVVTAATIRGVRSTGTWSWRTAVLDESPPAPDDRRTVFLLAACLGAYFSLLVLLMALVAPLVDRCV